MQAPMNALRRLEQAVLAEGREWMRCRLERQLQAESDAVPALCPHSGQSLTDTRWRDLQLHSLVGVVRVRVRHGYSAALGRWVCPAREAWGLAPYQRLSPEFEARLTYTATEVGSYERAARMAGTWGSPASDGCIHEHAQRLGAAAADLELPMPAPAPQEPAFSLVIMLDGWMARERGPDWGAGPRKKNPQRIAWHEIKSAVIYRLEQRAESASGRGLLLEKYAVATPPETSPVDFGAAVQAEARRHGLGRAKVVYLVMDGAVWLWDLADDRLADAIKTLDFHHARDHLWAVAHLLHGEDTPEARAWVEPLLKSLRTGSEARVVRRLEQLLDSPELCPPSQQAELAKEVHYFQNHRDHLHYQAMEQAGAPRGSGAAESLGKQLQQRLRGCGQTWSRLGFTHLLRLCVLVKNRDDPLLWN
jgi:hypothetical protein